MVSVTIKMKNSRCRINTMALQCNYLSVRSSHHVAHSPCSISVDQRYGLLQQKSIGLQSYADQQSAIRRKEI